MFFHIELNVNLRLEPCHFGRRLEEILQTRLMEEVEGSCSARYGFIVAVTKVMEIGRGKLSDAGDGLANFPIRYSAVIFKPFRGEVMDCVVTQVNKMGFFASAGPVEIFVSNHQMPEDMSFSHNNEPCYISDDQAVKISKDCEIRLRILGMNADQQNIFCIGTIKGEFLGLIREA